MPRKRVTPQQSRFHFASDPTSAKHRIEQTPKIRELEEIWYRSKPGELRVASVDRGKNGVFGFFPNPQDRSDIHTHVIGRSTGARSYHSKTDLYTAIEGAAGVWHNKIRFKHIASIDKDGNMAGYVTVRITPEFRKWAEHQILDLGITPWEIKGFPHGAELNSGLQWKRIQFLKKKGLQLRITPMPGYHFVRGYFVRRRK